MANKKVEREANNEIEMYMFNCPGCGCVHGLSTKGKNVPIWKFNGNETRPTFSPSILSKYSIDGKNVVCHSFITDGKIKFLNDCTHELKGKTVELPNF